jgi:very-short-patch-repair endonuclease
VHIDVLCDYCGKNVCSKQYVDYLEQRVIISKDCCFDCMPKKREELNLIKYGVKSTSQLPDVKIKMGIASKEANKKLTEEQKINKQIKKKQTTEKKYGVSYYSQTEEYKEKYKNTCQERYGVDNVFQSEDIKKKSEETCLKKYGVRIASQSEQIKNKKKKTMLNRYGVEYYSQSQKSKDNYKKMCQEKYGVDNLFQLEEIKEKSIKTCLKKYGVQHAINNKKIREKTEQTNLKRYGVKNVFESKEIQEKITQTYYKNGICPTSSQQIEINNMLKNQGYNTVLNYPVSSVNLDIAIFIDNIKIDVEYDGWYWHKDEQHDRRRDEFLKSQGWKVLRIKSRRMVPKLEILLEKIEKLIITDRKFTEIILEDWESPEEKEEVI